MTQTEAREKLTAALFADVALQEMVNLTAEILQTPVRFTGFAQTESFMSRGYPYDDFHDWHESILHNGQETPSYLAFLDAPYWSEHGIAPFILDPVVEPLTRRRYLCMAVIGSRRIGHMTIPETDIRLEDMDTELIMLCSRFLAIVYMHRDSAATTAGDAEAMELLLRGGATSYTQVISQASDRVFSATGDFRLLLLRPIHKHTDTQARSMAAELSVLFQTQWIKLSRKSLTLLTAEKDWSEKARAILTRILRRYQAAGCISPCYHQLMDTPTWEKRMFELEPYRRAEGGTLVFFSDWGDFALLREADLSEETIMAFLYPPVVCMLQSDEAMKTEYLRTLSCYLAHACNKKATADSLYLHINTVNYRMNRIRDEFGVDPERPGEVARLSFGIRMLQALGKYDAQNDRWDSITG